MTPRRGEVYFLNLNPSVGREQSGRRPVVVLSNDTLNSLPLVVTIIPGTRGFKVKANHLSNVRVPAGEANLPEETVFLTFQIRSVDHGRFTDGPIGTVSAAVMEQLEAALAWTCSVRTAPPPP